MTFTESNTVEQMILNAVTSLGGAGASEVNDGPPAGWIGSLGEDLKPAKWTYVEPGKVPRQLGEVMVEPWVREALIALSPKIAARPERVDEVIYAPQVSTLSRQT